MDDSGIVVIRRAHRRRVNALPPHSHRFCFIGRQSKSEEGIGCASKVYEHDAIAIEPCIALAIGGEQDEGGILCGGAGVAADVAVCLESLANIAGQRYMRQHRAGSNRFYFLP